MREGRRRAVTMLLAAAALFVPARRQGVTAAMRASRPPAFLGPMASTVTSSHRCSLSSSSSSSPPHRRAGRARVTMAAKGRSLTPPRPPTPASETTASVVPPPTLSASRIQLKAGKARLFLDGNPLVYGEAVGEVIGDVKDGDYLDVTDQHGNLIGRGLYNANSMYRVRLLWHAREKGEAEHAGSLEDIVRRRVATAWRTRQALGLPNAETDCFRLINGEGDRLSGLAADVFGSVCVVASSALWCERHRDLVTRALASVLEGAGIRMVWRQSESRLKQDGYVAPPGAGAGKGAEAEVEGGSGSGGGGGGGNFDVKAAAQQEGAFVWVRESGIKYKVFPELGQKTGFYADQRENRAMIRSLAAGKRVLDLYTYTGGFALSAGQGGCREAIGVDSSGLAVDTATENARANGLEGRVSFVKQDVLDFLKEYTAARAGDGGRLPEDLQFDIVVADPPKLAPSRRDLPRALNKYARINRAAMALVKPGGLFLTHTCSAALTQAPDTFRAMVLKSANDIGRSITVLKTSHAASCHVTNPSYWENNYLTAMLCVVF